MKRISTSARRLIYSVAFALLLTAPLKAATNVTYHLSFTWDTLTNADAYGVMVRSNGLLTQQKWTSTNFVTVSNLAWIDPYVFTCLASNVSGLSDESPPATKAWATIYHSDSLTNGWILLQTNSFATVLPQHYVALSNWSAASLLKRD